MITEDYVSFEIARRLEEKGFASKSKVLDDGTYAEECRNSYDIYTRDFLPHCAKHGGQVNAPSLQVVKKWLRKNYGLHIGVILTYDNPRKYEARINHIDNCNDIILCPDEGFSSDEEATEAAIKYCLEKLI